MNGTFAVLTKSVFARGRVKLLSQPFRDVKNPHIKKNMEEKHKIDVSQGLLLSVSVRGNKVATSSSVGSISVVGKLTKIKFIKISPIFALI